MHGRRRAPSPLIVSLALRPYDGRVTRQIDPTSTRAAFRRQAVLTIALPVLAVILVIGILGHVPLAGMLLAALLTVLAVLRLLLPVCVVGALAVRSRGHDVLVMLALAAALVALSVAPNL